MLACIDWHSNGAHALEDWLLHTTTKNILLLTCWSPEQAVQEVGSYTALDNIYVVLWLGLMNASQHTAILRHHVHTVACPAICSLEGLQSVTSTVND